MAKKIQDNMFGEFDSCDEINELAENLFNEGDIESIKKLAAENGIPEEFVSMYMEGEIPALCDTLTAALGKIKKKENRNKYEDIYFNLKKEPHILNTFCLEICT